MADQQKNRVRVSPLLYLSFIPFVNTAALFHMSDRSGKKEWMRTGWIFLIINISLIIGFCVSLMGSGATVREYPYDTMPKVEDYVDSDLRKAGDYYDTPEYEAYEDAYKQCRNSDEYKEAEAANRSVRGTAEAVLLAVILSFPVVNLFAFFYVLSHIGEYKKKLTNQKVAAALAPGRPAGIRTSGAAAGTAAGSVSSGSDPLNTVQKTVQNTVQNTIQKTEPVSENIEQLNINTASVEKISALPGVTLLDARKAIRYREEHGQFRTADEFFEAISAKPHVIAHIQERIVVSLPERKESSTGSARRRIDL